MEIKSIVTVVSILGMIIWFVIHTKRKTKYGINLKRVYCPVCNTKQPRIRKPLNERQKMYGGGTCQGCQTELDKYGDIVS